MKKNYVLTLLALISIMHCFAQDSVDQIADKWRHVDQWAKQDPVANVALQGFHPDLILISKLKDPYDVYIDDVLQFSLEAGNDYVMVVMQPGVNIPSVKCLNMRTGAHTIRIHQLSGYIFYATDKTYKINNAEKSVTLEFP